jgi:hypothetical protein
MLVSLRPYAIKKRLQGKEKYRAKAAGEGGIRGGFLLE